MKWSINSPISVMAIGARPLADRHVARLVAVRDWTGQWANAVVAAPFSKRFRSPSTRLTSLFGQMLEAASRNDIHALEHFGTLIGGPGKLDDARRQARVIGEGRGREWVVPAMGSFFDKPAAWHEDSPLDAAVRHGAFAAVSWLQDNGYRQYRKPSSTDSIHHVHERDYLHIHRHANANAPVASLGKSLVLALDELQAHREADLQAASPFDHHTLSFLSEETKRASAWFIAALATKATRVASREDAEALANLTETTRARMIDTLELDPAAWDETLQKMVDGEFEPVQRLGLSQQELTEGAFWLMEARSAIPGWTAIEQAIPESRNPGPKGPAPGNPGPSL
jgi:hypothetical protein